ncbi:DDE-type integrase/transposase/recombinase, partial [Ruminococcus sp. AF17-1AC]
LYVSVIFDCFDLMPLGIAIEDNMRASLCCHTLENANKSYPDIKGCIIHSDRGSQYTSEEYQAAVKKYGIIQSMNSAGGRCHDNARCESMWARMKEELFYSRGDKSEKYTMRELKTMIWRYYMSYWANRRICTANGGLPPAVRRKLYYDHIFLVA